ncbi:PAAR domain-containing protein [Ruegeria hyattellae]|uniref:PAAR domain-containing protein n=1 Tax=Ruegeria hyattellae TaxID=3233337 RepID=UPI00355C6EB3
MPGMPQARVSDMQLCNVPAPTVPPVPAPIPIIPPCCTTVLVGKLPAARVTDMHAAAPSPHPIVKGSMTVFIQKLPAARIGDLGACGGAILKGEFTVLTGG